MLFNNIYNYKIKKESYGIIIKIFIISDKNSFQLAYYILKLIFYKILFYYRPKSNKLK
jgi:hypothetical protein